MKRGFAMSALALLAALGLAASAAMSPVTRVVELLEGLAKQVETEAKAEEDLYETFVCWVKSITSQKTKSNAEANSRIEYLETYVDDLKAGRIELTTERVDLEKEIETLRGDLEAATNLRSKEAEDYETARDEMQKAIDALTQAIEVLKDATEEHKQGVLLALRGSAVSSADMRAKEAAKLNLAVELGGRMLTSGDAVFLQRLLTGEVPKADWKKLNRKATFKMDYKARSFKIQGVLAKMLETFSDNLKDATEKEDEAIALFNKLKTAKEAELTAAEDALSKMDKENGARALSAEEATEEINALKKQVTDDESYIEQVQKSYDTKKAEWKDRKALRAGELAAISKAVSILHSDDARDTFSKSFKSQDKSLSFIQEGSSSQALAASASRVLLATAAKSSDGRLGAMAAKLAAGGHFDEVITAVDAMLETLQKEEARDLEIKENCEKDRAEDTRSAILASRTIDEHTDTITTLQAKIEELTRLIEEKNQRVAEIVDELKEAKENREKENAEYLVAKKDDEDAATLVLSAQGMLENFYAENKLMFVQKGKQSPFQSTAGEAPPPPPSTWDAPYGGRTEESTGIIAILGMVHEDILKDIAKADAEEQASVDLYEKTKLALETEKTDLEAEISDHESEKGTAESDVVDNKSDRGTKKGELDVVMKKIKDAEPECAYFQINYPLRVKNRQTEVDGLNKAKAILSGGKFDGLPDPDREIKPGDALIQRKRFLSEVRRA